MERLKKCWVGCIEEAMVSHKVRLSHLNGFAGLQNTAISMDNGNLVFTISSVLMCLKISLKPISGIALQQPIRKVIDKQPHPLWRVVRISQSR